MGNGILYAVGSKLALDGFFGAARTVAKGIAALDHKAGDDAVEGKTIIKAVIDKLQEVFDGDGSGLRIQLHGDGAVIFNLNCDNRVIFFGLFFCFYSGSAGSKTGCQDKSGNDCRSCFKKSVFHENASFISGTR